LEGIFVAEKVRYKNPFFIPGLQAAVLPQEIKGDGPASVDSPAVIANLAACVRIAPSLSEMRVTVCLI